MGSPRNIEVKVPVKSLAGKNEDCGFIVKNIKIKAQSNHLNTLMSVKSLQFLPGAKVWISIVNFTFSYLFLDGSYLNPWLR